VSEVRLRVLIAGHDVDTVDWTAALFAGFGAEVAKAYTGRTALELALTSIHDVIVLDLEMPDMSGYVVARLLDFTPMPKRPLVVAVSEHGQRGDRYRCAQAGIDLHLTKPIDFSIFKEVLACCGARESRTQLAKGHLTILTELLDGFLRMAATFLRLAHTTSNPQSRARLSAKADRIRQVVRSHLARTPALCAGLSDFVLKDAMDRALVMMGADKGNIQLLQPSGELTIACQRGFNAEFLEHFGTMTIGDTSSCARAVRAKTTVVIEDVYVDEGYANHRDIASRAGFSAVTSTPIIESAHALGVVSAYFQKPHKPHRAEILRVEDCARDTGVLLQWAAH